MHSFKPLLENGHIEKQDLVRPERSPVLHDAKFQTLDLPDFGTAENEVRENRPATNDQPVDYNPPELGEEQSGSAEQMHVRLHADIKNKTFLPLLTLDPDEDPVQAASRKAEYIMSEATAQAEQMRGQAETILKDAHDGVAEIKEEAHRLNQQARDAVEQANQQAPAILEAAREEGFNHGYQDGMEQGMVAGQARLEALMADFAQAAKNLAKARDDAAKALTPEIVALVQACLDKIFFTANSVDAGLVARVVDHALSRLDEHSLITVRLNPANLEHIPKLAPAMWAKMQAMGNINWVPDPDLRPGDCVVDTPITQIDATVSTRRQRIFAQMEDALQQGQNLDLESILQKAAEKRAVGENKENTAQAPELTKENEDSPDNAGDNPWVEEAAENALNPDDDW